MLSLSQRKEHIISIQTILILAKQHTLAGGL